MKSKAVEVQCVVVGPRISRRLLLVALVIVLAVLFLSAYVRSLPGDAELFCIKLNQASSSEVVWDGEVCLMKDAPAGERINDEDIT